MLKLLCGKCGKQLRAPETAAGKKARCPGCGEIMDIPTAAANESRPPQPSTSIAPAAQPIVSQSSYTTPEPGDKLSASAVAPPDAKTKPGKPSLAMAAVGVLLVAAAVACVFFFRSRNHSSPGPQPTASAKLASGLPDRGQMLMAVQAACTQLDEIVSHSGGDKNVAACAGSLKVELRVQAADKASIVKDLPTNAAQLPIHVLVPLEASQVRFGDIAGARETANDVFNAVMKGKVPPPSTGTVIQPPDERFPVAAAAFMLADDKDGLEKVMQAAGANDDQARNQLLAAAVESLLSMGRYEAAWEIQKRFALGEHAAGRVEYDWNASIGFKPDHGDPTDSDRRPDRRFRRGDGQWNDLPGIYRWPSRDPIDPRLVLQGRQMDRGVQAFR
jgi:phage FluMu protein Com